MRPFNREITHMVKTDSLPKTQLVVRTKCSFCCHLRETYVKTKNKKIWDFKDSNSTSLSIEYIGEFMTLTLKDPMPFGFFYKLTPQLIQFNIPTHDWISFPALGGTGVFSSGIVNPIINIVKFSFCVSVYFIIK